MDTAQTITGPRSQHPLATVWYGMIRRCYSPASDNYRWYGAIGIRVCDEWRNDREAFIRWAEANGWSKGLQIDRYPNRDGNYEPGNVRFVTCKKNNNNRSSNLMLTVFGETKTAAEWAQDHRCKAGYRAILKRKWLGWTDEQAVTFAPSPQKHKTRLLNSTH